MWDLRAGAMLFRNVLREYRENVSKRERIRSEIASPHTTSSPHTTIRARIGDSGAR
jgi:hypothetical protein